METIERYRDIVQELLEGYAAIPYPQKDFERELIVDRERDRYLLLTLGWDGSHRVYGVIFHLDIRDGKIWIQSNNTDTELAPKLVRAGVLREHIVIGLISPDARADTDYAVG